MDLDALFGLPVPSGSRDDLVTAFLTGIPGLNKNGATGEHLRRNMALPPTPTATRSRLGALSGDLDGFPNGRRLEDDTVDPWPGFVSPTAGACWAGGGFSAPR